MTTLARMWVLALASTGASARPTGWLGVGLLLATLLAALLGPLSGYDVVTDVAPARASLPPGVDHWLGTDHLGRDVAWRTLFACQAFAGPALVAVGVALALAVPAPAVAGFHGGAAARGLGFALTVVAALPRFVLVLLVCAIYPSGWLTLALAAGLAYAPALGADVLARVEELRRADYVDANRAYGLPGWRILWVHLVGAACARLIARHLVTLFGSFVVLESTLSYLGGFGVREPRPSWGNMLVFEWGRDAPWAVLAPAAALWATVLASTWAAGLFAEAADA